MVRPTVRLLTAADQREGMARGSGLLGGVSRLQLLVAGLVVTVGVGLAAFAGSLVVAAMVAVGALTGPTSLWMLVGLLVFVLAAGVGAAGAAAAVAWHLLAQLRDAVKATRRRALYRAYRRAREFEDESVLGRLLRPAQLFTARSDREGPLVEELQRRYVAGELDEAEFERELGRLLGDGAASGRDLRREIAVTAADGWDEDAGVTRGTGDREADRDRERERESGSGLV